MENVWMVIKRWKLQHNQKRSPSWPSLSILVDTHHPRISCGIWRGEATNGWNEKTKRLLKCHSKTDSIVTGTFLISYFSWNSVLVVFSINNTVDCWRLWRAKRYIDSSLPSTLFFSRLCRRRLPWMFKIWTKLSCTRSLNFSTIPHSDDDVT